MSHESQIIIYATRWLRSSIWRRSLYLAIITTILNSIFSTTHAQSLGTTISPPFKEVEIKADQAKANFDLTIHNTTSAVQTLKLSVQDFGSLDESGGVAFLGTSGTALEHKYGLASWLSLGTDIVTVGPNAKVNVAVTIENRPSLTPGGHYGAILLTSQGEPGIAQKPQVVVTQVLSTLVFVKKVGGEEYNLLLNNIDRQRRAWQIPTKIKLRFQNAGNVHVVPRGTIEIFDPRGKLVAKGIINPESGTILPESFRVYSNGLIKTAASWLPGKYTLKTSYRYDGKAEFTTQTQSFFYIGQSGLAVITIIVLLLSLSLFWFLRFRKKKRITSHSS